ncbi:MAG TPA: GNAT family N-acetyltransferase [Blastocatellia bacterium]|nr:GNAT family N-acetyltransferase [Blastocatellia bacterium]
MGKHAGKLNLQKYEKNVLIRPLRLSDYDSIVELQQKCFPGMEPWTHDQFESQISIFPEGQIGVEYLGRLVASSSSVILDFALYKDWQSWEEISDNGYIRNHNAQGNTLYGIEMMVDPSARGLKLARRLYDARDTSGTTTRRATRSTGSR